MGNTVGSPTKRGPVTTEAKSRNGLDKKSNHYTPASLLRESRNILEYITGYIDGEGCFTVEWFGEKKENKNGNYKSS